MEANPNNPPQGEPSYRILLHSTAPLVSDFISINRAAGVYILNFRSTIPEVLGTLPDGQFNLEINLEALPPHTRILVAKEVLVKLKEQIETVLAEDTSAP